jgi:hypothetical protein
MYNEDVTRVPKNEPDMWELLWQQFEYVRHVLWELPVESKEDALGNMHHKDTGEKVYRSSMAVVRYRDTGNELDQRDHFLAMGRELLPYVHQTLDERKLTPEFVQQWGKIMFCHGYIASYVLDDTDDLLPERNRKRSADLADRTPQRVFLARLILWFMTEKNERRKQADVSAATAISSFLTSGNFGSLPEEYHEAWFQTLLSEKDPTRIPSTMSRRKIGEADLRELGAMSIEGLPEIDIVLD